MGQGQGAKRAEEAGTRARDWVGVERERGWWARWLGWLLGEEEMVVLWDYRGLKPDEITMARGRLVLLRGEKYMPGRRWRWAWVKDTESAKEGFIPRAFLAPHRETCAARDTYSGRWYHAHEDPLAVARALREDHVPMGTFAVCNLSQGDLNALDELVLLVRLAGKEGEVGTGEGSCRLSPSPRPSSSALPSLQPSQLGPSGKAAARSNVSNAVSGSGVGTGSELAEEDLFRDHLVEVYQVKRDTHGRYYLNPGAPSPNLYSLVSRLKSRPMTVSVRLGESLGLRSGETERRHPVPPPPAHPTRVPLNQGPNIHSMSNAEKRDLLRPFGIRSKHVSQEERIGQGNFGTVHKGIWHRRKQGDTVEVAVKNLVAKDRESATVFREEALVMATLDHPNVIAFFGYDEARQCLVTELLPHGSLLQLLKSRDKSLSQHNLLDMVYQVACGMAHVVDQGVVHRDLSARNCLIGRGEEGRGKVIKVADFGLARPITEHLLAPKPPEEVAAWRKAGAEGYPWVAMAIESLAYKIFSPKSDVWAFGILMQEVWSLGGLPYGMGNEFDGDADKFLAYLEKGGRVSADPAMPESIFQLQTATMHREPKHRPDFDAIRRLLLQLLSLDNRVPDQEAVITARLNSRAQSNSVLSSEEAFENV